ncbi:hypothetical protein [Idiomarina abyssalis]|uniref:Uncharacterized protein n=1 Tax=Idiomarina abyssalis TaxID=86102 RepID=A0A8I1GE30_9GAMM|nr:hypothetical protein [Idiomarina abyssalis]MBJ7265605.1 hypothetical protein [Idiomarina abyssalis]MBJ7316721.1 hypothetical protein [Idiomarina abyssalis]
MKILIVNGFYLAKKAPTHRCDNDFERNAINRASEILDLATRYKAKVLVVGPWYRRMSDKAAFEISGIFGKLKQFLVTEHLPKHMKGVFNELHVPADGTQALSDKSRIARYGDNYKFIEGEYQVAVTPEDLPSCFPVDPTDKPGVLLVKVGTVNKVKDAASFEIIELFDDNEWIKQKQQNQCSESNDIELVSHVNELAANNQKMLGCSSVSETVKRALDSMDATNATAYVSDLIDEARAQIEQSESE